MIQAHIKHDTTHKISWIDNDPRLCKGCVLSLKNDPRKWVVYDLWPVVMDKSELHKKWDVGGL